MEAENRFFIKLTVGSIILLGIAFQIGWSFGFNQGVDLHNKVECESKFRGKSLSEVDTECVKYFN